MKITHFITVLSVLLFASHVFAQKVEPTSLTLVAVPGYSSSPQNVSFTNIGDSELILSISITGPFSLPVNKCGRGVKPGTHCNVDIVYTPVAIETDSGTLDFTFNGQTVSVALTGDGVSIIPTKFSHMAYSAKKNTVSVTLYAEGDIIPDGEQVELECIDYDDDADKVIDFGTLKDNKATIDFTGPTNDWDCAAVYWGDAEFAPSADQNYWINQCRPVKSCHDLGNGPVQLAPE